MTIKNFLLAAMMLPLSNLIHAQTKIFKEVSEDVASEIKTIHQDGALVGYLVFTRLEKASADSFNYKLTILDENLNDIGKVNFREKMLTMQSVAFEQDLLCLAYIRSNVVGNEFPNNKQYKKAVESANSAIFTQFLDLEGKIIASSNTPVEMSYSYDSYGARSLTGTGKLAHELQLRNISGKGFAMLYGDKKKSNLLVFDVSGKNIWKKEIKEAAKWFAMLTSGKNIHVLVKTGEDMADDAEFQLLGYNTSDSSSFPKYQLKDKQGNALKVLSFDNDPITGKPYITGNIIRPDRNEYACAKTESRGLYTGVFTIMLNGPAKSDIVAKYSYWSDGSNSAITKNGYLQDNSSFARHVQSFRDYQGNSYFVGSAFVKKVRWAAIGVSTVTLPFLFPPALLMSGGTHKAKITNVVVMKQTDKGALTVDNTIAAKPSPFVMTKTHFSEYDFRTFATVNNPDTKTSYLVINDPEQIKIYNVNQKKVIRTIARNDGNIRTAVFGAKEGHIMVAEYNKKQKSSRFSIEAI